MRPRPRGSCPVTEASGLTKSKPFGTVARAGVRWAALGRVAVGRLPVWIAALEGNAGSAEAEVKALPGSLPAPEHHPQFAVVAPECEFCGAATNRAGSG